MLFIFKKFLNFSFVIVAVVSGLSLTSGDRVVCTGDAVCDLGGIESLNFFLIGDVGGFPIFPYYTYAQNKIATAMAKIAEQKNLTFVLNVGDNFYFNGVESISDLRFKESFEEVYEYPSLNVPFYTIAGNHDHLGNISAQLFYTNISSKWIFPSLYYRVSYVFGPPEKQTQVEILMLDTIVLCGNTVDIQGDGVFDWLFSKKKVPLKPDLQYQEEAQRQWAWIEKTLSSSRADYLFVVGHYPVYSTCEHGSMQCLINKLDPLLREYNVTAYFSGHDHNVQHIQLTQPNKLTNLTSTMNYIVSGAGSRSDRSTNHLNDVGVESLLFRYPKGWNVLGPIGFTDGAFVSARVDAESAKFLFLTGKNTLKYETVFWPRTF